jgi:CRP/FNR family cyclic AMP-dependent transcriptional regulator
MSSTTTNFDIFKSDPDYESFSVGQIVFKEGEIGEVMYFILEGEIDISIQDKSISLLGAGEIFGEMALINTKIRSATATAKVGCKLIPINERRFIFLIQQHPFFALNIMRILADRLRRRIES